MCSSCSELLSHLPDNQKVEAVAIALERLLREPRLGPQSVNFGRRSTDHIPVSYEGMKTADAAYSALRSAGRPMTWRELIEKLQAGGCKIAEDQRFVLRNLCIAIGSSKDGTKLALRPRFVVDGNLVGLMEWQRERKVA